ncbi:MAG: hypothetical protein RLY31_1381 [Bacteroidota bacterium]|jgi:hypothetical protein
MRLQLTILLAAWVAGQLPGQGAHSHAAQRAIDFPDVPGYRTLACDLHIHSVFSDGSVWPDIRVQEAVRDSLDLISLTEHLEYQPHGADIPHPDRNRSYALAEEYARPYGLLIAPGSEITRDMPPGHTNAIFISDGNKLLMEDPVAVFREANQQGAFLFWNHPNWIAQRTDGVARLTDMHRQFIAEGLLHGIEVVNELTYSDEALQIALDHNLTIMGTSDIHGLVDWNFDIAGGGHRPVTLVLAEERSLPAIKAALFDRRTVVWHNNTLIGRAQHLQPLLEASVGVTRAYYNGTSSVAVVELTNRSDAEFVLLNQSGYRFHDDAGLVVLPPHGRTTVEVKTGEQLAAFELSFAVLNTVTAPGVNARLTLPVTVP